MNLQHELSIISKRFTNQIVEAVIRSSLTELTRESGARGKELHVRLVPQALPPVARRRGKRGRVFGGGIIGQAMAALGGSGTAAEVAREAKKLAPKTAAHTVASMLSLAVARGHLTRHGKHGASVYRVAR